MISTAIIAACVDRDAPAPSAPGPAASTQTPSAATPADDPSAAASKPTTLAACRFASFSPAMTQVLVDLGLGAQVVGRTPFCDSVPNTVPTVGSLLDVDYERLIQVAPTHLLVQPAATGTDPELERLAQRHGWVLIEQGLDRLEDVEAFLAALVPSLELHISPELTTLAARCAASAEALESLRSRSSPDTPIKTLVLVGTEPLTAAGADTFVSQMLVAAGGVNAITADGYPELTFEDLAGINPAAIVILRETAPSDSDAAALLRPLRSSPTRAAADRRIAVHVDPMSMLPSTKAPEVVERLRTLFASWPALPPDISVPNGSGSPQPNPAPNPAPREGLPS
ncbi:MAG: hypothetical protein JNL80_05470 [Phycisphaerae bacterium]|jgi:ABC-type hemin transport system substrate-binding protein|nr:hypothetical protein [Phycisphaerae bacterium]